MTESDLYWEMQRYVRGAFTRIENSVSSGIFDVHISTYGRLVWVENKIRKGNRVKVRGSQYVWGMEQLKHGVFNHLFFLVGASGKAPRLYSAASVFSCCNPKNHDNRDSFIVDLPDGRFLEGWPDICLAIHSDPLTIPKFASKLFSS